MSKQLSIKELQPVWQGLHLQVLVDFGFKQLILVLVEEVALAHHALHPFTHEDLLTTGPLANWLGEHGIKENLKVLIKLRADLEVANPLTVEQVLFDSITT